MEVPAWKSSLMKYRSKLRSVCHVGKFLPDLRQQLTAMEYSCVQNKPDDVSRVDELVRILLTKDERHFEAFCSVLERNGYPLWAKLLKPKVAEASALRDNSLKRHYSSPGKMTSTTVATPDAKPEIPTEVSTEKITGRDWSVSALWSYLLSVAKGTSHFGVLVVGETGTGKSALINNLVGKDVVKVGYSKESETSTITERRLTVQEVPFILVDTPGLSDSRVGDEENLEKLKDILGRGKIHLVIYCMKFSETRMRASLIHTFKEYHRIGLKWEQTVIALTFADALPFPKQKRNDPNFKKAHYFDERFDEMRAHIACVLEERVGVVPDVAKNVKCYPTTEDCDEKLLNGKEWYVPLWLEILNMQSPSAAAQFLAMHAKNIEFRSTEEATSDSTFPPSTPHGNHSSVPVVQAKGVSPSPSAGTVAGGTFTECSKQDSSDQPNTQQKHSPTQGGKSDDIHAKARPIVLDPNQQHGFMEILSKKFERIPNFFRSIFFRK